MENILVNDKQLNGILYTWALVIIMAFLFPEHVLETLLGGIMGTLLTWAIYNVLENL